MNNRIQRAYELIPELQILYPTVTELCKDLVKVKDEEGNEFGVITGIEELIPNEYILLHTFTKEFMGVKEPLTKICTPNGTIIISDNSGEIVFKSDRKLLLEDNRYYSLYLMEHKINQDDSGKKPRPRLFIILSKKDYSIVYRSLIVNHGTIGQAFMKPLIWIQPYDENNPDVEQEKIVVNQNGYIQTLRSIQASNARFQAKVNRAMRSGWH